MCRAVKNQLGLYVASEDAVSVDQSNYTVTVCALLEYLTSQSPITKQMVVLTQPDIPRSSIGLRVCLIVVAPDYSAAVTRSQRNVTIDILASAELVSQQL